jgi:uncharacterized protein (TIGR02217 family)
MSTQVFPTLIGQGWSVTKAPQFATRIQRSVSGRELRTADMPYPVWNFALTFSYLPTADFNTLLAFFLARQGSFDTFLYSDPTDNSVWAGYFGTGTGSQTVYQLERAIAGGGSGNDFFEPVTAPNALGAIYLNGVVQSPSGYSVDPASGLVTFASPPAPGLSITADFSFFFRCRFADDTSEFENFMHQLWQLKKLQFVSVLL